MSNKLKKEDTCLTVEQSQELQELGVEMKGTIKVFYDFNDQVNTYKLVDNFNGVGMGVDACGIIPTLTNTEMLEMIPKNLKEDVWPARDRRIRDEYFMGSDYCHKVDHYPSMDLDISFNEGYYGICYFGGGREIPKFYDGDFMYTGFSNELLRDSLFEIIKWLKTNYEKNKDSF